MRSLFLRLLVSMWAAMAILTVIFALINAAAFPSEAGAVRQQIDARAIRARASMALACSDAHGDACAKWLEPIEGHDDRIAIYRGGELVLGSSIDGASALIARATKELSASIEETVGARDLQVALSDGDPTLAFVGVSPARSPWIFFIGPDTLIYRVIALVVVTGLIAAALARWITRPIGVLRRATQEMAAGDLSVRVEPRLPHADSETLALGRDMDSMAARIDALLTAQRRLLRDVSHELRSPLARLGIALELVRRKTPPEATAAFERIERETDRLNTMIGELLTLSRLESEQAVEREDAIHLGALVRGVVEDVAFEAEKHEVEVVLRGDAKGSIRGDHELLRRAIENVMRNALRFTERGTRVEIDLEEHEDFEIRVRDHGPGVPEASLERIFEPFYRVETDRERSKGGTGIGLAITERALRLHAGSVRAANADGGGLVVTMHLPRTAPSTR